MQMLKAFMHRRERHLAMLNDDRLVRPFAWGTQFVGLDANIDDPGEAIKNFSAAAFKNSDEFFRLPEISDFVLQDDLLIWTSAISTPTVENNTARARFFPARDRRAAVVVLPHWNAKAGSYHDLCRVMNRVGLSALRVTLPYHEERRESEDARADHLVSANVGRTLQSVRQAVLDARAAVRWLKEQGYEKIGVVGTSMGSCTAFLALVHDTEIDAGVFNHVSGYFADVVWRGLSTYHVREGLEGNVTLDELRELWLPISPLPYLPKLKEQKVRPLKFIYTLYDLTFPHDLSLQVREEITRQNIPASFSWLPCGHYTLGEKPWMYLDGYKIVSFLRRHLR
jgi:Dienelactone hydrolase family